METSDEPIVLLTDQHPLSGIGTYATQLHALLRDTFSRLEVYNAHYFPFPASHPHHNIVENRFARSWLDAPYVLRHNLRAAERSIGPRARLVHLCGADYQLALHLPRTIATVHDYSPRLTTHLGWAGARSAAVEAYTFMNLLRTPRALRRSRSIVSISEAARSMLSRRTGLESAVIHHWADRARFYTRPSLTSRRILGLPEDRPILLNVSAGTPNKNLPMLTRLVLELPPSYLLVKVGHPVAGPANRVRNVGSVDEQTYPLYFNAADAYVHVSLLEGFGYPVLEAMSSGTPVLAIANPPAPEVLGSAGHLVPSKVSAGNLALAVRRLVEDREARVLASEHGLSRAAEFSPAAAAARYREVYLDALPN